MISLLLALVVSQSQVCIQDEGVNKGCVPYVNFVGAGVTATISGKIATVAVDGGTGGGGGGGGGTTGTLFNDVRPWEVYRSPCSGGVTWYGSSGGVTVTASVGTSITYGNTAVGTTWCGTQLDACNTAGSCSGYTYTNQGEAIDGMSGAGMAYIPSGSTGERLWMAVTSNVAGLAADNASGYDHMGFRLSPGISPNWYCCQGTSAPAQTCVDSGVVAAANTVYTWQVERSTSSANTDFWLNGTKVCSFSTNKPIANLGYATNYIQRVTSGGVKSFVSLGLATSLGTNAAFVR